MIVRSGVAAKAAAALLVAGLAMAQAIRPARTNPPIDASRTLEHAVTVPPTVAAVLDRACADCHSNRTTWPWYSNVAPVSWFVIDHVNHGRTHFNMSDWARHAPDERNRLLGEMCKLVESREMPLASYTWIHRHAVVSDAEARAICDWTRLARSDRRTAAAPQ